MHAAQSRVGKRLVDLSHLTADGRLLLDDVDLKARISDIERGLNTCNTAADNERALCYGTLARDERRVQVNLCDSCSAEDYSLLGSAAACPYVSRSTARGCWLSRP